MIKGILIGVGITLGVEGLIALYVFFNEIINEKISWLFDPLLHPFVSCYCIKIGINPWKCSIRKILELDDEKFNGWLNVLNQKDRKAWEIRRKKDKEKNTGMR